MSQPIAELYTDAEFFSPYAMSAFITLTEKGIPFTVKPVDLSQGKNHEPAYAALSLTRRVPTLWSVNFSFRSPRRLMSTWMRSILPIRCTHAM